MGRCTDGLSEKKKRFFRFFIVFYGFGKYRFFFVFKKKTKKKRLSDRPWKKTKKKRFGCRTEKNDKKTVKNDKKTVMEYGGQAQCAKDVVKKRIKNVLKTY